MHASLSNSAQLTLTRYAKAKALLRYAKRLRQVTDATSRPRIGLNDLIMFATARAVAQHPPANSWFDWEGIKQFGTSTSASPWTPDRHSWSRSFDPLTP